jgi:glycosyltransferase involved in cell wall biosynthesis
MSAEATSRPLVSIIVPARNEEASLAACLESLVAQTGVAFEIIVVDDHSTDRTREIASRFSERGVRVIEADSLPSEWTGKNNALITGSRVARGEWLLFTDADTVHLPGSLVRALAEARDNHVDMLSYSPEQIVATFWEKAVLPVVFAELARQYPPAKVSDPASTTAAANGQFILIRRAAYDAVGGHAAVAGNLLEDVALAQNVKRSGYKLRFRYAADAVRTRMYRNFSQLQEGWTKNLALLFPNASRLAVKTLFFWVLPWIFFAVEAVFGQRWLLVIAALVFVRNAAGIRRANFDMTMNLMGAAFGMPMFAYLLLRSQRARRVGIIAWKGRSYGNASMPKPQLTAVAIKKEASLRT